MSHKQNTLNDDGGDVVLRHTHTHTRIHPRRIKRKRRESDVDV